MDQALFLVVLGAAVAGFVQGLSGFAFGLVAMAFWAWSVPPQLAGPMVVAGSLIGQAMSFGAVRRSFDLRRTLPFLAGGAVGVPAGAFLLPYVDQAAFKTGVGVLLVVWCPAMLLAGSRVRVAGGGRLADGAAGLVGGAMGGLSGLPGPAPTLWCTLRGWEKNTQRAVFQSFNLAMHGLTLGVYTVRGLMTPEVLGLCALVVPALLVPSLVGARLYARIGQTAFRRVILTLLMMTGVVLLVPGRG